MPALELPELRVQEAQDADAVASPILINRDPAPGETGVPLDWLVALEVVDVRPEGMDLAATRVWVDGVLAFDAGPLPGFDGPRAEVTQTADTLRIVLHPAALFESEAVVEVRVVSATASGVTLDETYAFAAEDRTAPGVVGAQAVGQRTVRIGLDEPVLVTDPAGFAFEALDGPAVPVLAVEAAAEGAVVTVQLDTEMTADVRYRVVVTGVADASGNPVVAPNDRATFAGFRPQQPPGRRFDLWSMLPRHNRRDDATGDLRRFIACLQEVTDLLLADLDRTPDIFDLERAPEPFLDLILRDLGNPFAFDLDKLGKRRLASVLSEMYLQKGTAAGGVNAIRFFLGIDVEVLPHTAGGLVLGESELGVDWVLGPSSRFALYAFNVRVARVLDDAGRRRIRAIVNLVRPGHTHFVSLLEPTAPPTIDHWVLGLSELGTETVLH